MRTKPIIYLTVSALLIINTVANAAETPENFAMKAGSALSAGFPEISVEGPSPGGEGEPVEWEIHFALGPDTSQWDRVLVGELVASNIKRAPISWSFLDESGKAWPATASSSALEMSWLAPDTLGWQISEGEGAPLGSLSNKKFTIKLRAMPDPAQGAQEGRDGVLGGTFINCYRNHSLIHYNSTYTGAQAQNASTSFKKVSLFETGFENAPLGGSLIAEENDLLDESALPDLEYEEPQTGNFGDYALAPAMPAPNGRTGNDDEYRDLYVEGESAAHNPLEFEGTENFDTTNDMYSAGGSIYATDESANGLFPALPGQSDSRGWETAPENGRYNLDAEFGSFEADKNALAPNFNRAFSHPSPSAGELPTQMPYYDYYNEQNDYSEPSVDYDPSFEFDSDIEFPQVPKLPISSPSPSRNGSAGGGQESSMPRIFAIPEKENGDVTGITAYGSTFSYPQDSYPQDSYPQDGSPVAGPRTSSATSNNMEDVNAPVFDFDESASSAIDFGAMPGQIYQTPEAAITPFSRGNGNALNRYNTNVNPAPNITMAISPALSTAPPQTRSSMPKISSYSRASEFEGKSNPGTKGKGVLPDAIMYLFICLCISLFFTFKKQARK